MADEIRAPAAAAAAGSSAVADPSSSSTPAHAPIASSSNSNTPASTWNETYRPQSRFSFPAAAQPEIVRAYQKDTYYKDLFTSQVSDVVRSLFGTRVQHSHVSSISLVGALGYHLLSTSSIPGMGDGRGGQTLGEEYVNSIPQDVRTGRIVTLPKRLAWILLHVLGPYALTKLYARVRRYAVARKERFDAAEARARTRARALDKPFDAAAHRTARRRLVAWLARNLPPLETLQSQDGWLAYLSAAHLMLFYLGGRFYTAAQRLMGVRYISTYPKRQGYEPPSYEVLGVLLGVQLAVKLLMELRGRRRRAKQSDATDEGVEEKASSNAADPATTVVIDSAVFSHASQPAKRLPSASSNTSDSAVIELLYPHPPTDASAQKDTDAVAIAKLNTSAAASNAHSTLQCTLCMDQRTPHRGSSAVTECGHCFDWSCITAWIAEKPECPLCRQPLQLHRILPIYNF